MPFLDRLLHTAKIYRPTTAAGNINQRVVSYPADGSPTYANVPCLLVLGAAKQIQEHFGLNFMADGIVQFGAEIDVQPTIHSTSGMADRVVVTDETGDVSTWYVKRATDPGGLPRRAIVAAVTKNAL